MFQIKFVEKNNFMISNFFSENRAVYEIMSKKVVEPERPQMTMWGMGVACWISNATRARSHTDKYVILIALP